MKFIGDFHIHSHYSIATSKKLVPEEIAYWAKIKGIKVVGTGDFAHPGWTNELKQKLEPAEPGLFKLKKEYLKENYPATEVRFILTAEISNIYKKGDKVRKVHNLIFAPDFETVEEIQSRLDAIGNIESDGRPILGLDSRDLLEIVLESGEDAFLVPAHIWTPWFSALGSKSGFNTIAECYGDLTEKIFAIETGLSSDPPMNWICSFLDKFTLISNSDAHSPQKLGREANLFDTDLNYNAIKSALRDKDPHKFLGTIEFFPQEGKYHFDGHRKCGIRWSPLETIMHNGICPVCGKKVTVGVMNRVAQLADRENTQTKSQQFPFNSLLTLKDILSQIHDVGTNTKTVAKSYNSILKHFTSEFDLLLHTPIPEIERKSNEVLAEAIRRMREKEVRVKEGFDGEYGQIKVFEEDEIKHFKKQKNLFEDSSISKVSDVKKLNLINFDIEEFQKLKQKKLLQSRDMDLFEDVDEKKIIKKATHWLHELNEEQTKAVKHFTGPQLIIAGPGTGKTRVLTNRIKYLILNKKIAPEKIVAITFTNRATEEMKKRLQEQLAKADVHKLTISTFHAFGLEILKNNIKYWDRSENFSIFDEKDRQLILTQKLDLNKKQAAEFSQKISEFKHSLKTIEDINTAKFKNVFRKYEAQMQLTNAVDIEDLLYKTVMLLEQNPELLAELQNRYSWYLIDEYQDINKAQYKLIKLLLADSNPNICAIGDPDQAIYGFRGADVGYIKKFKNDFKKTKVYQLTKSYRCSDKILTASSQVMLRKNKQKSLLSGLDAGVKLNILESQTDKEEAERVARTIESMMGGLRFFSMDS
ncbi:MAG: UvrD-helicase domain-containing protein, partial [Candidatus Cloacimonetes bacterium]|nr:UvrD-helicase domain-containing protein [Candidatus Cloacimonadota bacterium]